MDDARAPDDPTAPRTPRGAAFIRIFGEQVFFAHPAPQTGSLTIGRSDECDIVVNEHSVSRVHARLHFGGTITIEDAGSSNGTRIGGVELRAGQRSPLLPGQVAELGVVLVTIDASACAPAAPRRIWEHSHFEARVDEHCTLCRRTGGSFAIARIIAPHGVAAAVVEAALAQLVGDADALASYAPGQYEAMLLEGTPESLHDALVAELPRSRGGELQVAIARFPDDGVNVAALQSQLSAALASGSEAGGSDGRGDGRSDGRGDGQIVVLDDAMIGLHRLIDRVAGGAISVLLTGETGAGKEVLAERIHLRSPRRNKPFLRLNCAALVESLMESELFGHDKGAFTGAARAKPGLFEATAGGTVFLDEIGEMPLGLQAKLLRVLDERQVRPVGSLKAHPIDVRFVAATNRSLEDEIARGRFRQDLYFRLSGVTLAIPPLRQRPREILALADLFLARAARAMGLPALRLGDDARAALTRYPWPGNVRELKNVIERAVLLAHGNEVGVADLGLVQMRLVAPAAPAAAPSQATEPAAPESDGGDVAPGRVAKLGKLHDQLGAVERQRILEVLDSCGGNQSEAARRLGISRNTLLTRLDRYGAPRPRRPSADG